MPRYPWSDGTDYVTQCPIQPGKNFTQQMILSDEEGTLWWHAHSDWSRNTVHGAIVILPPARETYPFPKPHAHVPIIIGMVSQYLYTTYLDPLINSLRPCLMNLKCYRRVVEF